jgi:hypothetical protein
MPDFVGTRADVAILIRDSQYVIDNVSETMLISAVSGSLDRLSAERDPPVRYDNTYKVWVYLHGNRPLESPKWDTQVDDQMLRAYERHTEKYNKSVEKNAYKSEPLASQ